MRRDELASAVAAAAALAVVVLVVLPYLLLDAAEVGTYYSVGPLSPAFVAVLAAVAGVALLAASRGRSDPAFVAGLGVVLGLFMTVLAGAWAVAAGGVVGGLTTGAAFEYHRWAVAFASLAVLGAAGWFARLVVVD